MIDVRRNNRPTSRHLITDKFRCNELGNRSTEGLAGVLMIQRAAILRIVADEGVRIPANGVRVTLTAEVFADRNIFHLRRDDTLAGVMDLRDALTGFCTERSAL